MYAKVFCVLEDIEGGVVYCPLRCRCNSIAESCQY